MRSPITLAKAAGPVARPLLLGTGLSLLLYAVFGFHFKIDMSDWTTRKDMASMYLGILGLVYLVQYVSDTSRIASLTGDMAKVAAASAKTSADVAMGATVVAWLDVTQNRAVELVVKNYGPAVAMNIAVRIEPDLLSFAGSKFIRPEGLREFMSTPVSVLPPGHELRTIVRRSVGWEEASLPLEFSFTVTYETALSRGRGEGLSTTHTSNLSSYFSRAWIKKDGAQIAENIKLIADNLAGRDDALGRGLLIESDQSSLALEVLQESKQEEEFRAAIQAAMASNQPLAIGQTLASPALARMTVGRYSPKPSDVTAPHDQDSGQGEADST